SSLSQDYQWAALAWVAVLALTLPSYLLLASTRWTSAAARGAFLVALCVHLLGQAIGIGLLVNGWPSGLFERPILHPSAAMGTVGPRGVLGADHLRRRRIQAGRVA